MNDKILRFCDGCDLRATDPSITDGKSLPAVLEGYAAVFNRTADIGGWFYEIIEPGAFDGTDFKDVALFVNHETKKIPLARLRKNSFNSTMKISTDNTGLFFRATLDTENNDDAKKLYSAVKRGDISGMSLAFSIDSEEWADLDKKKPSRRIKRIAKVFEISACNYPAYKDTEIQARGTEKITLENARSKFLPDEKKLEFYRLKIKILGGN